MGRRGWGALGWVAGGAGHMAGGATGLAWLAALGRQAGGALGPALLARLPEVMNRLCWFTDNSPRKSIDVNNLETALKCLINLNPRQCTIY